MDNGQNNIEERINETAKRLFIEHGFENTSMSEIASEVGINRPTLHYYYHTKEIMFRSVFGPIIESLLPQFMLIIEEDSPIMTKIEKILDGYIELFRLNPDLPLFVACEIQRDINHLVKAFKYSHFDEYLKKLERLFITEMEEGRMKRVDVAYVFLTFYSQLIFPFITKEMLLELFFDDKEHFDSFFHGWKQHILRQMRDLLYD